MALPQEKQPTVEQFKAQMATLQPQRRAALERLRADARANVFSFVAREYPKGYSLDQIGDRFLGIAKRHRLQDAFVKSARETLTQIGWKPKRERA